MTRHTPMIKPIIKPLINLQQTRLLTQAGFFIVFIVAPVFDIFRLDLYLGHLIIFGQDWTLGLEAFQRGEMSSAEAALNILLRVFLPLLIVALIIIGSAWKYGRLYCGWLCPHFSVVETINQLMLKATGKQSVWDPKKQPDKLADGSELVVNKGYWILVIAGATAFAYLWAVVLLTYLLPPKVIYYNLFIGELTRNQTIFISVATFLLSIEFLFARHLFCRFACAVGVFQSLAWMGNKKAMVVGFNEHRANDCSDCNNACDNICPMRLKPRTVKRNMFTCTTCGQCISACETTQQQRNHPGILQWVQDECAIPVSSRGFGKYPDVSAECFKSNTTKTQKKPANSTDSGEQSDEI